MMLFLPLIFSVVWSITAGQDVIVDTQYGQVQGRTVNVDNGRVNTTVQSFHAIPFGKETSGTRRFASPEPVDPWDGVFVADTPGDACPQSPFSGAVSEDCLHVDIVSPDVAGGPYPVMVWLYGGAYQFGSNDAYPGHFFASKGVVYAAVNYRLATFGFAYTGNAAAPGNAGLWDQRMGIQFVVDNIANFGGDPNRITVFGESAGAGSTAMQMLSPQSKDLFQQAILQSGAEINFWVLNPPESSPENYIHQVAQDMNCDSEDDQEMIDCLRGKSWQDIYFNSSSTCTPGYFCLGMAPVVDGPGGFLPDTPAALRASGDIMRGPIISGINKEDGGLFVPMLVPEALLGCCNRSYYLAALEQRIIGIWADEFDNVTTENVVRASDFNYSPWPYIYDNEGNRQAFVKLITDGGFGHAWDTQLKAHSEINPDTYGYVFSYKGNGAIGPDWMGVTHGEEITYLFGHPLLGLPSNEDVRNDSGLAGRSDWSQLDIQQSIFMQDLWTNFAKTGNPTPEPVDNPQGGTTVWPNFSFDDMSVLQMLNTSNDIDEQWEQKNYAFFREYLQYLIFGTSGEKTGSSGVKTDKEGMPAGLYTLLMEAIATNTLDIFADVFADIDFE